jgi:hypothetical protein
MHLDGTADGRGQDGILVIIEPHGAGL